MSALIQHIPGSRQLEAEFRRGTAARPYLRTRQARRVVQALQASERRLMVGSLDVTQEVIAELRQMREAKLQQMARDIPLLGRHRERAHVEDRAGGGYTQIQIHPVSYHYWGQRLGYECWDDKQFVQEYLRDNDYARIQSRRRQPQVGWTAAREERRGGKAATGYLNRNQKVQLSP